MKPQCALALFLAVLLSQRTPAQGKVLVVDDQPGPGVDYQSIVLAVQGAQEGDTILIKHGVYLDPPVEIVAKSLTLVAENFSHVLIQNQLVVRNLGPEQSVVLRGLHVEGFSGWNAPIQVLSCLGSVWLEEVLGTLKLGGPPPGPADVMLVKNAAAVTLVSTTLQGFADLMAIPGAALRCVDSNLALYDCDIIGNPGKEPGACGFDPSFSPGGHALHCSGGFLFCSGSTLTGGKGGDGTCCPFTCSAGAEGGSGVLLQAGATEPEAVFLDTTSAGGPGGAGGFCPLGPLCDDGVDGMGYEILAGSGLLLPGNSLSMTASSPIREGGAVTIDVHGPPGVEVFLGIAGEPAFQYYPPLSGVLLAEGPYVFIHLGAVPGSGALKTVMPLLFMPPSIESMTFHGQAAYLDPLGAVFLGGSSAVTLLDAAF